MNIFLIVLVLIVISAEVARELCFKFGSDASIKDKHFIRIIFKPIIWLGFTLWTIQLVTWIFILQRAPLSLVFPMLSLSYCGVVIASHFLLKEKISFKRGLGVILITIGVAIISNTGKF